MQHILKQWHALAVIAAVAGGVALAPGAASAQSELDAAEAEAFMGEWDVALVTDMGPFNLDLVIEDQDGMVAANMGSPEMGGSQEVTDITREGESLILAYDMNAQGQVVPVAVTLTPDGEELAAEIDFAGGMFIATGSATRAES